MEPLFKDTKRQSAAYVAYRQRNGTFEYYLQKRDSNAPTHKNVFAFFGGALEESEKPVEALYREVEEELNYHPTDLIFFGSVERVHLHCSLFLEKVAENFESQVTVSEGEYGSFLTHEEAKRSPIDPLALVGLEAIEEYLCFGKL